MSGFLKMAAAAIAAGVAVQIIMRKVDAGEVPWLSDMLNGETEKESETYA